MTKNIWRKTWISQITNSSSKVLSTSRSKAEFQLHSIIHIDSWLFSGKFSVESKISARPTSPKVKESKRKEFWKLLLLLFHICTLKFLDKSFVLVGGLPYLGFIHIVVPNKSLSACRCCRGHNHDWIGPALKWIGSKWSVGQPDSTRLPLFHFQSERSLQQFPCSALNGWPWPQCKVLRKFENFFASPQDEAKMRTPQVKCPSLQCQIVAWTFCCRQQKFLKHVDLKQYCGQCWGASPNLERGFLL